MQLRSISTQLVLYYSICVAILIGVSGLALHQIVLLNEMTVDIGRHHLPQTRMLGKMADLLSEVRMDQANLVLGKDASEIATIEASAAKHMTALRAEGAAYRALPIDEEEEARLQDFEAAQKSFVAEHEAWIAQAHDLRLAQSPAFQRRAHILYERAEHAIDGLIDWNAIAAEKDLSYADGVARRAVNTFALVLILAVLLSGAMLTVVRSRISRPLASITKALSSLAAGNREARVPESDRRDEIGEMAKALEVFRANAVALEEARYDMLTGLPNRRVLSDELEKALGRVDRGGTPFAVLVMDLDRFKPVNDIHGHQAGDVVLGEIATRLKAVVRKHDTLARTGGDEFAIIFELDRDGHDPTRPILLAERIIAAVSAPISIGPRSVEVGASIGIALCPADGMAAEKLLHAADIAMYRAKAAGRGTFRFYEQSMDTELRTRAALEADVHRAMLEGGIRPHYQPLIDLSAGAVVGFEILARWDHPETGPIAPDVFIPVIEHLRLMSDFTLAMLRRACLDAKEWPTHLRLSLNVSPHELTDSLFPIRLLAVLSDTDFSPRRLEIEITENALIADLDRARAVLQTLQELGITIALDDFGTGYSSLYHLRELHLDKIKIDRSFIQSMKENPESAKIVYGILGLAKSLALPATAEGIEDQEIMTRLSEAGCEIGQGYYFAKAMPAAETLGGCKTSVMKRTGAGSPDRSVSKGPAK